MNHNQINLFYSFKNNYYVLTICRGHYIASVYASKLIVPAKQGLIVNISSPGGFLHILDPPCPGIGKAAVSCNWHYMDPSLFTIATRLWSHLSFPPSLMVCLLVCFLKIFKIFCYLLRVKMTTLTSRYWIKKWPLSITRVNVSTLQLKVQSYTVKIYQIGRWRSDCSCLHTFYTLWTGSLDGLRVEQHLNNIQMWCDQAKWVSCDMLLV